MTGERNGTIKEMVVVTPVGTIGSVVVPGTCGRLFSSDGEFVNLVDGEATDLKGGRWTLVAE